MAQKPSIPKGTRDFSPLEMMRRTYMFDTIRRVFRTYGYAPLETPAMENLSTLTGKYGEEGDKLLFKILNSGDFTRGFTSDDAKVIAAGTETGGAPLNAMAARICEKGLRYDLTVPFARYVVQHQAEITFPFRRYQVQPVWRADRPQKGRYREFYQCDVDVIGTRSLLCEFELVKIVERVFGDLGINVTLKLNNRKILYGIAETIGHADKMTDITVAIDKLDKIGIGNVEAELASKGIGQEAIAGLRPILELSGTNTEKLARMKEVIASSKTGMLGIAEMEELFSYIAAAGSTLDIELDLSLARGLNYYTGAIFEVKAKDHAIGSICGGGRYDDLTGIFGMPNMSGVGISFGADRRHRHTHSVHQFWRTGTARLPAAAPAGARCGHPLRNLSRTGQDEETDGICQPTRHTFCRHRRRRRTRLAACDRKGDAQRRTTDGSFRQTVGIYAALTPSGETDTPSVNP